MRVPLIISVISAIFLSTPALSQQRPEIFIYGAESGYAWWLQKAHLRPMGQVVDGITADQIDLMILSSNAKVQYMSSVSISSYAGVSRIREQEITSSLRRLSFDPFYQPIRTRDGLDLSARIILIERLDGAVSLALVVYDKQRKVLFFEEWPIIENDEQRSVLQIIYPTDDGLIGTKQCLECGDASLLQYDSARKRFYWEYVGD